MLDIATRDEISPASEAPAAPSGPRPLRDPFGRTITYLRLSVTDRCDLRCTYCMPERMRFLPKRDLLSLEELEAVADAFIRRGVRRLRITGGEPLVRPGLPGLIARLSRHLGSGALDEITLTTNATQLDRHAEALAAAGVRRINVSLDSLNPETYRRVTRGGDLFRALSGIAAAKAAGIAVKLNAVALKHDNAEDLPELVEWAHAEGHAVTLIEVMPTAETGEDRRSQFLPLLAVREALEDRFTLTPLAARTGGPARYVRVEETGGTLGFITPLTENFCAGCNRVRVTCTGKLALCLGQEEGADLRPALRGGRPGPALDRALDDALLRKPERHGFEEAQAEGRAAVGRHMNVTGG
ncbi:GTP 3',8-cyclase MoaA [Parvularcula oceani]|uniref:GTP 3',8-cyclase MoaA n=1 Tax=Parvularcula oceani TaxID=1247963 RepID=UPI0004E15F70|nr:GTP 3',8-cyclase MoaA [Parvularcula oceani]